MKNQLEKYGYTFYRGVIDASTVNQIVEEIEGQDCGMTFAGIRNPETHFPSIQKPIQSSALQSLVQLFLPGKAIPVRSILFDKSADTDWGVPWHQDLTISVQAKHEVPGFNTWTLKDSVQHVQPPVEIMERMVTLRIHLDDTNATNGALRVIPESHRHQRLSSETIAKETSKHQEIICEAKAGDILVMKPLLLHSSKKGISKGNRRILHVEFSADDLPSPLTWQKCSG
jgi:ectoine hydroxylase-related dioxygenase (phytanoyl-CoA dioxygenase family)